MPITTKRDGETYVKVRFLRGTCVDGVDYGPKHRDEPVEVRLPVARLHVDHLHRAEYVKEEGEDEPPNEQGGEQEPEDQGFETVAAAREAIPGIEDVKELQALREVEAAGQDRKGVYEALDDRLAELSEESNEEPPSGDSEEDEPPSDEDEEGGDESPSDESEEDEDATEDEG